jgi:hypothetical protein
MINVFDAFNQQDKPHISLCNPNYDELYSLSALYNTDISLRWNSQSEFSFTYPKTVDGTELEAYSYIEGKRIVFVENVGYFVIHSAEEDYDGIVQVKQVTCLSHEATMVFKKINLFSGTYMLYNASNPSDTTTLLGLIMPLIPNWSINSVDSSVASLYRTFDISDSNVYQFFTTDASTSYGCIFNFNLLERSIDIIAIDSSPAETDIYLSFDNLLKDIAYEEITEEITTCLYCYGGNDLTIRNVNPLGSNSIYNFTYYKTANWMSQGLIDAIDAWEAKVILYQSSYDDSLDSLSEQQILLLDYQAQLAIYQEQLAALQEVRTVRVAAELDTTDVDSEIEQIQIFILNQNALISISNVSISEIIIDLGEVNTALAFTNTDNFTEAQYLELDNFIFESTYKNDNITQTDSMTVDEIQAQSQLLYDAGVELLDRISVPRYEISVNLINFLTLQEYEPLIDQLELGDQITIDSGKGYDIDATLLSIQFGYDDPNLFSIILGNRQRIADQFTDFVGQSALIGNSIAYGTGGSSVGFSYSYSVTTTGSETGGGGGTGVSIYTVEDLSGQIGANFNASTTYLANSLRVFINGIYQKRNVTFAEGADLYSFIMYDPILIDDTFTIEYIAT